MASQDPINRVARGDQSLAEPELPMNKPRILHLVIDLSGFGGAEMTLLRYLATTEKASTSHAVLTLKTVKAGPSVGAEIEKLGVPVHSLGIRGVKSMVLAVPRLFKTIRALQPDVLSAWLYYPSLIASLIRPFLVGRPRVIWHIRSLPFVRFKDRPARWLAQRLLAMHSHLSDVHIISNSEAARVAHAAIGFQTTANRWQVIPNAVDASRYTFNADARASIRAGLHLPDSAIVIGTVGRNVPEKGYPDLFKAFGQLQARLPSETRDRLHLMIAGRDVTLETPSIAALVDATGLPRDRFHLLGARGDVVELLSAMDLFVMPSRSESFPNALAEAMAVGLPAVATDVGDCRVVLDDDRFITTADTLADGLEKMIMLDSDEQQKIGARNRQRITEHYTLEKMTAAFDKVFEGR